MTTRLGRFVGSTIYVYQRVAKAARTGRWPLTIGVRIIVRDDAERVLLVRHTYSPGWHFPGGAIDRRETAADAAARELREEARIEATSPPRLIGVYLSTVQKKSDHIVLYEAGEWRAAEGKARPLEIAEASFFPIRDLPRGTTGGTRRRVAELLGEGEPSPHW